MKVLVVFVLALVGSAFSKSLPDEDSVVSVYTTQATTSGTSGLDIYQQIANNIAERISTPFYRLFRTEKNKTENRPAGKKPWKIELLEPSPTEFNEDNEISSRDVEELSEDALLKKRDKKPEKVTLYNSYLPVLGLKQNLEEINDTLNDVDSDFDDEFTLDDVESTPREGTFIYFLELIASFVQIAWGAIQSIFPSFSGSNPSQTEQSN